MNTGLCDYSSFEGCWADHPNGALAALPIVDQFIVFEDLSLYRILAPEALTVDSLDFETVKEAFSTGIVVAISLGAHAA